jgi:hypothetical protein
MPPKSVANRMDHQWHRIFFRRSVAFRFYPQCRLCSGKQGSILSRAVATSDNARRMLRLGGGSAQSHFHGFRLRLNHLTGGVLAGMVTIDASDSNIRRGNAKRYREWQWALEDMIDDGRDTLVKLWKSE